MRPLVSEGLPLIQAYVGAGEMFPINASSVIERCKRMKTFPFWAQFVWLDNASGGRSLFAYKLSEGGSTETRAGEGGFSSLPCLSSYGNTPQRMWCFNHSDVNLLANVGSGFHTGTLRRPRNPF